MKKFFLLAAIFCALLCQGKHLRIDITGLDEFLQITSSVPGSSFSAKPRGKLVQKTVTIPAGNNWGKFIIEFTSPRDAEVHISFRSTTDAALLVDDIKGSSISVRDGGFEKLTSKKRFANWKSEPVSVVTDASLVHSGKVSGRITYQSRISQSAVKVKADEKVTLTGFYRREIAVVENKDFRSKAVIPAGANAVFDPTMDRETPFIISTGRLEFRSTFENCSVYLNLLPAEKNKKLNVEFFYRKEGTQAYLPALPPAEVIQEHAWRGSIFNLTENTPYEFKAVITGKGYKKEVTGKFRTMNSRVPFETVTLAPGKVTAKITSGTPDKYKRYTSNGKVITAVKGSPAVFNLENMEYIIFEDMVIDAKGAQNGFMLNNCRNIIIRNCEVFNFGRTSAGQRFGANMYYSGGHHDANGALLYDDVAFRIFGSKNVLVERCFVHDPNFTAQTWLFAHPSGPGCVKVSNCANTVLRWNDFVGRDTARFIDHIIGPPNGSFRGGFTRDADIYGNFFAFSNDDGAELEGGGMNIRCYSNRIENTLSGMSTGPISLGPTYLIGNLFANPGDEEGSGTQAYKNGGGTKGVNHTRGKLYMLHNTISEGNAPKYGVGCFSIPHKDYYPTCKAYLRNNLIRASGRIYHRLWHTFNTDCDYNLLERTPGINPILLQKDIDAIKETGLEKHGIYAKIIYADAKSGNYALKKNAPGWNMAQKQNNFADYPHCGAYKGKKGEWFPVRPLDMTIDKTQLRWLKDDNTARTLTLSVPANEKFTVFKTDEFYTVKETARKSANGRTLYTYTVALDKSKMSVPRRYQGAILFRSLKGLSLPVTLYADGRLPLREAIADTKRFIPAKLVNKSKSDFVYEAEIKTPGTYFMALTVTHAPETSKGYGDFTINGQTVKSEFEDIGDADWVLLKTFKLHRLIPVELQAGKVRFTLKSTNGVVFKEAVLTREPWVIMRNRGKLYVRE